MPRRLELADSTTGPHYRHRLTGLGNGQRITPGVSVGWTGLSHWNELLVPLLSDPGINAGSEPRVALQGSGLTLAVRRDACGADQQV